jgi:hypothetical protein|tara:strand:+ start:378 stop:548 length:171 start_codon:yes stop_codon:yes gene_type:complete
MGKSPHIIKTVTRNTIKNIKFKKQAKKRVNGLFFFLKKQNNQEQVKRGVENLPLIY